MTIGVNRIGPPRWSLTRPLSQLVAALLPSGRGVEVGRIATALATFMIASQEVATGCAIWPPTGILATFVYIDLDKRLSSLRHRHCSC